MIFIVTIKNLSKEKLYKYGGEGGGGDCYKENILKSEINFENFTFRNVIRYHSKITFNKYKTIILSYN